MKKIGLIKRKDFILLFALLILCALLFLFIFLTQKEGNRIEVWQNGKIIMELSLEDTGTYVIEDGEYYNELVIKDGVAFMKTANCKDLVCVNHGAVSKVNETITCLPHKLIVCVVGDKVSEMDAVVE